MHSSNEVKYVELNCQQNGFLRFDVISTFDIHLLPHRLHYHCFFFNGLGIESCILPSDLELVDKKLTTEDKRGWGWKRWKNGTCFGNKGGRDWVCSHLTSEAAVHCSSSQLFTPQCPTIVPLLPSNDGNLLRVLLIPCHSHSESHKMINATKTVLSNQRKACLNL